MVFIILILSTQSLLGCIINSSRSYYLYKIDCRDIESIIHEEHFINDEANDEFYELIQRFGNKIIINNNHIDLTGSYSKNFSTDFYIKEIDGNSYFYDIDNLFIVYFAGIELLENEIIIHTKRYENEFSRYNFFCLYYKL